MRLLLFPLLTILPMWAQTSATLSTAQYRAIYSAAQLIEAADACELDWKPYHEAFVNAQKKKALAEGWSLGTQARATLQLREIREGLAAQLSAACSQERQDSLSIRLEVEKERLTAEADPGDDNWVLKPRGKNWLHISGTQPVVDEAVYSLDGSEISGNFKKLPLGSALRQNGRITWIENPVGAEKTYARRWIAPNDLKSVAPEFLNLRPLFYYDEDLEVLATQARLDHSVFEKALNAYQSGDIEKARRHLEEVEEDTFVRSSTEFWLLRAYIENQKGRTSKARSYVSSLSESINRNSRTELLMRNLLFELGGKSFDLGGSSNGTTESRSNYNAIILEIARNDSIEVLGIYSDGAVMLAFSESGGIVLERYHRERLIWDVQLAAITLVRKGSLLEFGVRNNMSGRKNLKLPEQGSVKMTLLNGRTQNSKVFPIRMLDESIDILWFKVRGLLNVLKDTYYIAEIDR
ncbi:MAG: hypothetical protein ACRBF0_00370 [Calditrichia bacterium]